LNSSGILQSFKSDTALTHVQLPASLAPGRTEGRFRRAVPVQTHQIDRHVVLLRGQSAKRQGLAGIAVVPGRITAVRHEVPDHPILHPFRITGRQLLQDHLANGLQGGPTILG
jgi:hypothetical protein